MVTMPAKLITGILAIEYPVDFNNDINHPAYGAAFKWVASIKVVPQTLGIPTADFSYSYNAGDIVVGDWIASTGDGKALRIAEITNVDNDNIQLIVEDYGSYNAMTDTTISLDGTIYSGDCIVFGLNSSGLPVLGPITAGLLPDIAQDNIFARFNQFNEYTFSGSGGGSNYLGTPTDTTYADGAIKGWVPGLTTNADAFDQLNWLMARALPNKPADVGGFGMDMANSEINPYGVLLADGVIPNNTSTSFAYADPITAISSVNAKTKTLSEIGLGNIGELNFSINGTLSWLCNLTPGNNTGVYGGIEIVNDYDYPPGTSGIWQAMDVELSSVVPDGINEFTLSHSLTGTTSKRFVVETLLTAPAITFTDYEVTNPVIVYSSGVPHYSVGTEITFSLTAEQLVGRTFAAQNMMGMITFPNIGEANLDHSEPGMPTPLVVDHGPIGVTGKTLTLNGTNTAMIADFAFYASNAFNTSYFYLPSLIYTEGSGQFLVETPDSLSPIANIKRVALDDGDRPVVPTLDWATNFDSGSASSLGDLQLWDAPIIGGIARANRSNYGVNYLPVGPDFSGKPTVQYLSFKIKTITNRLKLEIDGTYAGVYVCLPGIQNDMPNAVNGWWDGTKQADNAPLNWPGHANASDGCLLSNDGSIVEFTFGNISSAASTDNIVLVRFKLSVGDEIKSIRVV